MSLEERKARIRELLKTTPPAPWKEYLETGWLDGADGSTVVEYLDCGTHCPRWGDGCQELVLLMRETIEELLA